MGNHSADNPSRIREALYWAVAHRRKILAVAVVALPLVARVVPGFPAEEVLTVVTGFLGA